MGSNKFENLQKQKPQACKTSNLVNKSIMVEAAAKILNNRYKRVQELDSGSFAVIFKA